MNMENISVFDNIAINDFRIYSTLDQTTMISALDILYFFMNIQLDYQDELFQICITHSIMSIFDLLFIT